MPDVKELQTAVQGAVCFAVLDAYKGYWQLGIDEESSNLMVIQVGTRLYRPKRTPQGGTSSAQTFQAAMHRVNLFLCDAIADMKAEAHISMRARIYGRPDCWNAQEGSQI